MLDDVAVAERAVSQRRGGHVELVVARQRMEVEHPRPGTVRRQAHAENTVHPVERDAFHAVVAVQRVRVEIRMVDPARRVLQINPSKYNNMRIVANNNKVIYIFAVDMGNVHRGGGRGLTDPKP